VVRLVSALNRSRKWSCQAFASNGGHCMIHPCRRCHAFLRTFKMNIELYFSPGACSLAPHITLNEIGESFELRRFSTAERANYLPAYLSVNPKARIPALKIDDFVLTETPAILTFLGRHFPDSEVYPVDDFKLEARCQELLAWSSNTVHVAFAQLFRPERFVLEESDYGCVKESGHVNFRRYLAEIEEQLTIREFALGSQFSVVDPFWLVFYRWGVLADYAMRTDYPAFTDHAERMSIRASTQKALELEEISIWG